MIENPWIIGVVCSTIFAIGGWLYRKRIKDLIRRYLYIIRLCRYLLQREVIIAKMNPHGSSKDWPNWYLSEKLIEAWSELGRMWALMDYESNKQSIDGQAKYCNNLLDEFQSRTINQTLAMRSFPMIKNNL